MLTPKGAAQVRYCARMSYASQGVVKRHLRSVDCNPFPPDQLVIEADKAMRFASPIKQMASICDHATGEEVPMVECYFVEDIAGYVQVK